MMEAFTPLIAYASQLVANNLSHQVSIARVEERNITFSDGHSLRIEDCLFSLICPAPPAQIVNPVALPLGNKNST